MMNTNVINEQKSGAISKQDQPSRKYTIGEFARMTATTERTLRFYDRKGLLKPSGRNAQGHRFYEERDLLRLQQILTMKYLDFTLDEIAEHLNAPGRNLAESMKQQRELLIKKRDQLDKAIGTLARMERILDGADTIDSSLLLFFIHNIQNEEEQKRYLAERLPAPFVGAMFMEGMAEEERLERERRMTAVLIELTRYCREGRSPDDAEVRQCGMELTALLNGLIGQALQQMDEEQKEHIERTMSELGNSGATMESALFYSGFTKEEEQFIVDVMEKLEGENAQ